MQHYYITILLVASICIGAHGKTFLLNKDLVTSLLTKGDAVEQDKNHLNLDNIVTVRTPSSAVQDWSLVCQQLCGAALGGAVCAPYCKNLPFLPQSVQFENAEELMDSKKDYICPELCGLQLGDDVCTCKNYITGNFNTFMKTESKTNVCAVLCDHNSVTLTGCTPCNKDNKKDVEYLVLEAVKTLADDVVQHMDATTTTTTTPNWNELCASLCKTGDGGSLCNCDLSPFFFKLN